MAEWDWGLVRAQCLREAQGVLGQSGGAEDAAQEAAVRAWRRQDSCLTPERPQPWVATIARNEALRIAGDRSPTRSRPRASRRRSPTRTRSSATPTWTGLAGLSGVDRDVIRGRYWDDLDYRQLGRLLHVPEGTARVRLHRALARLREALVDT